MIADLSAISDRGLIRPNNEDIACIGSHVVRDGYLEHVEELDAEQPFFWAVADGVGGNAAGEVASMQVVGHIATRLAALERSLSARHLQERVNAVAIGVHRELIRQGMLKSAWSGMATTLTGLLCYDGSLYLLHAGDSRLYRLRGEELVQLSRDHTLREFTGNHAIPGNILVNCFGGDGHFFLDFVAIGMPTSREVSFLLCSDGLSDMVADSEIAAILREGPDSATRAANLVARAREAGGHDNITLIIANLY